MTDGNRLSKRNVKHRPQNQTTVAGDVVRDMLRKHPTMASRAMARHLHEKFPKLFKSVDSTLTQVRYHRGACGNENRKTLARGNHDGAIKKIDLPKAHKSSYEVYELQGGIKYIVLSDIHLPYHDRQALRLAIRHGKRSGCNGVLINGDMLDFYKLSRFTKDPERPSVAEEFEALEQLIDYIIQELKPKAFVWKLGNHEARWEDYLCRTCPEIKAIANLHIGKQIDLESRGVTLVESGNPIRYGNLMIVHGHEWGKGLTNPVNPARGAFLKTFVCTIVGHQHISSNNGTTSAFGVSIPCWSLGCMCQLHPEYATLNKWNHGFGILDTRRDWTFNNFRIVDGEVKPA